ncbi:unnamed protein product [Caretta caretta]
MPCSHSSPLELATAVWQQQALGDRQRSGDMACSGKEAEEEGIAMENVFFLVCSFKDPSYSGSRAACLLETEVCVSASVGKLSQLCRACFFPLKSLTLART